MRKSSLVTGQQLTGANKQEALQQLAHAAATTLNLDEIEVKATLMTREALADTALISGIAIPHIIIDKEFTPRICVVLLASPLEDWDCLDGTKVHLLLAFAVPQRTLVHQQEIREISEMITQLADEQFCWRVSQAQTVAEVSAILSEER